MSWRQFARRIEAESRRHQREAEREARRRHRELQAHQRAATIASAREQAEHEVGEFENYLDLLVSVHKDCSDTWDWQALLKAAPPPIPVREDSNESVAVTALHGFTPGLFARLFGGAKKQRAALEHAVARGRALDEASHEEAMRQHAVSLSRSIREKDLASRILAGDAAAYAEALEYAAAFEELSSFETGVTV